MLDALRKIDRLSLSFKRLFCERIICLYRPGFEAGWWQVLEDGDYPLFAPSGRIVEAPLAAVAEQARRAVDEGFRPVFFIPHASDWPRVYEALEHYQGFAQLYVYGRHDQVMRQLLYHPSQEILEAYTGEGRLVVPNLAYGKALDSRFEAHLSDFDLTGVDNQQPLMPIFQFIYRPNNFRRLDMKLDCKTGTADFSQFYQQKNRIESCNRLVRFRDWRLEFTDGECPMGQRHDLIKAIAEWFEFPIQYQGWEPQEDAPWKTLLKKLRAIASGTLEHLSSPQQALLSMTGPDLVLSAAGSFPIRTKGSSNFLRIRGTASGEKGARVREPIGLVITHLALLADEKGEAYGIRITLHWVQDKPTRLPQLKILVNDQEQTGVQINWEKGYSTLTLCGLVVEEPALGWLWRPEDQELLISLKGRHVESTRR